MKKIVNNEIFIITRFQEESCGTHQREFTKNQIDYIIVSKRTASGIYTNKTRSYLGADIGSDHDLVMKTMRVKLKTASTKKHQSEV